MPSAKARDFQRVARLLGFTLHRTTGSHERWVRPDGRGKEIGPPLFFKIVRALGITVEEFEKLR